MKKLILFLALALPGFSLGLVSGNCEQGGNPVLTSGIDSTTLVQRSFPACSVTVYLQGTLTPATIYADSGSVTPLPNPFTADPTGYWVFYSAPNNFDVLFSGTGIIIPYVKQYSISSGSGGITNLTTTSPIVGGPISSTGNISCPTCTTNASALTINQIAIGGGGQAISSLGSLGTTTTFLHGNASGPPSFGPPFTLTTTGSSGPATFSAGTLNIPQYTGGSGGVSSNFVLTRTSNTIYTISTPASGYVVEACGNKSVRVTTTGTIILGASSAPTGAQFWVYYSCASGVLKVDVNSSVTSGNVTLSNITLGSVTAVGFPNSGNKLVALTAGIIADQWDTSPTTDWQANQSITVVNSGADLTGVQNSDGSTTIGLDTTVVPQKFFGTGVPGSIPNSLQGDKYYNTASSYAEYTCASSVCSSSPTWNASGGGGSVPPTTVNLPVGGCSGSVASTAWTGVMGTVTCGGLATPIVPYIQVASGAAVVGVAYTTVPYGWTSGRFDATLYLSNGSSGNAIAGTLETACIAPNASATVTFNATQAWAVTSLAFGNVQYVGLTGAVALTMTGCAAGDVLEVRVSRTDSSGANILFMGLILKEVVN